MQKRERIMRKNESQPIANVSIHEIYTKKIQVITSINPIIHQHT